MCQVFVVTSHDPPCSLCLDPRNDIRSHSPTGFEWGYIGSGPTQLALALLADATEDDETALRLYHRYKGRFISTLPHSSWIITQAQILEWVKQQSKQPEE